jgi:dynein heavy chain
MLSAGCDAEMTTFVLTDTQIMYESFLEDVNNLLNTGEITNLYLKEDYDRMITSLSKQLTAQKLSPNKENAYI